MGTATPTTQLPSLVVLPFVNTSADLENEFFCDGLAEDLISALTKLAQLRVVARTSAFSFKGQNLDVREIGRQLNVGAVLEGSVRRAGNRLRITAQIVNVADGFDLWSERYDRQLTDIFDIQDEITLAIVEALKVKLLSGQQAVLLKRPTDNLEAWEWYQKALWHHSLFNPTSFNKAIECCQKAVETDPGFATAWAWLSVIYSGLIAWTGINQAEYLAMAGGCAQKAIGLDDRLAESHAAMGIYQSTAFDVQTGGRYLRRALDLNPNQPSLRHGYAVYYLAPQGLFDEALAEFQCAHHSDPLSMPISSATGYAFYVARRYEEGVAHLRPLIEMAPNFAANYLELGRNLSQLGRLEESIEALEKSVSLSGGVSFDLGALGHAYGLAGRRADAERIISQLRQRNSIYFEIALVYAGMEEVGEALRWLELALANRQSILPLHLKVEPGFDGLRGDPRFADLLERVYGASSLVNGARSAAELFQQAERLYYRALELGAAERTGFLTDACGTDEELRREVESLLAAHDQAGSFIAGNAVEDHAERIASPSDQLSNEDDATAMLPNPLTESAQRRINQYRILSLLGKGGMGEVWLAEDTRLKRKVALKLLPAEFTNDTDRLRRFEQEALAISALNHPNIITIHEIGESDAGRFIVMELVAGRTLRAMTAESIPLDSLIAWGSQLAKALHVAHDAGITHRDIKPDNIMVRDDGYVKVLDFGLARLDASRDQFADADSLAGTKSGVLLGTVKYMSPEQARGEKVTSATDIFALGVLFYELATGTHPFNSATLLGTLQQITTETPRPPAQLNSSLPAAIDALIQRMLTKDAGARPSASQLEAALREIERQQNSGTVGGGALQPPTLLSARRTVGRKPERLELRAAFNSAKSGRGSLLCVAGEPGIGKTTLVEDFLTELAADGQCTIARGRCSERLAGTEAYLPLLEALDALLRAAPARSGAFRRNPGQATIPPEGGTTNAETMRQLAPTWYAQVVPLSGDSEESARLLAEVKAASQERMKRELANFLQAVAQTQPLVLFFDDLHWADVSTIDLLSFLAGKFDALNVLVVVTYRPSDMLLAKHPFLQIKPDLQARGACRELLLEFLTEAEIAEYLALEFPGHRFPPEFPQLIHAKTEGSPLFMADLMRYLRDRSVIANTSGAWTLAQTLPDIERELPESVRGMIERKIAQLSEDDHKLLTCASVQGYEFDSAVVAQVLNLEADEVEERLEKLERIFAFVKLTSEAEFPNGTLTLKYRFVHVLYQNALYAGLRVTRKATLSRDVALALEACYGTRSASVANELALLWEAARDYARASDSFLQAAGNAAQINAHREAVQLAERGLEALLKLPETQERDERELGLQLTLGFSLMYVLSWAAPEAGKAIHRARQLCQQLGDDSRLFAVLNGAASYHVVRGEFGIALELGKQMRQIAEQAQNPALIVVAAVRLAEVYCWRGEDQPFGRQQFEQAIALDRQEYHPTYLLVSNESQGITARRNGCYCLWMLGYNDQALAYAKEGRALAEQLSHPFSLSGAYLGTGVLHYFQRDLQASQKQFEKIFALAEQYDLGDLLHWAVAINSLNLAFQEPTEAAFARARQAVASLRAKGVTIAMTWCLAGLGEAYWQAGRTDEGLAIIAEAMALAERTGERSYEADLWRIKGELLLQLGADDAQTEAESCYQKAIAIAQQQSTKIFELRAATSLARLWQQQGKTAEARQMLAEIYGWFTEGFDTADLQDAKALLAKLQT